MLVCSARCCRRESDPAVRAAAAAALGRLAGPLPSRDRGGGDPLRSGRGVLPAAPRAPTRTPTARWSSGNGTPPRSRASPSGIRPTSRRRRSPRGLPATPCRSPDDERHSAALPADHARSRRLTPAAWTRRWTWRPARRQPGRPSSAPRRSRRRLTRAMATGHVPAAAAAARILGRIGTAEKCSPAARSRRRSSGRCEHADRRLRFAALEAIVQLQPVRPFAGSSYVPEALAFFAASTGSRRAMVAGPNTEESRDVGGFLIALGYEVDTAASGTDLFRQLLASGDYELVLVDAAIQDPPIHLLDPAVAARRADGGLAGGHRRRGRGRRSRRAGRQERSADRGDGSSPRQAGGRVAGEAAGRLGRTRGRFAAKSGSARRPRRSSGWPNWPASPSGFTISGGPRTRCSPRWARPS